MKRTKPALAVALTACLAIGSAGCFGENLLTGALKVANGQLSQLTATEIMQLNEAAIALLGQQTGAQLEPMTEAQAQAFADFLKVNDINTIEDFQALTAQAEQDPGSLQGLSDLGQAFQGSDPGFDPDNVNSQDLENIFNQTFAN